MSDLQDKLQGILQSVRTLQNALTPTILEPSHLNWDNYIELNKILTIHFQNLIEKVDQVLKYFVVYPVKADSPDRQFGFHELLYSTAIPELLSEMEHNKETYFKSLEQRQLPRQTNSEKQNIEKLLSDNHKDHHLLLNFALTSIDAKINEEKLAQTADSVHKTPKPQTNPQTLLKCIETGEGLPVPPDFM